MRSVSRLPSAAMEAGTELARSIASSASASVPKACARMHPVSSTWKWMSLVRVRVRLRLRVRIRVRVRVRVRLRLRLRRRLRLRVNMNTGARAPRRACG